MNKVVALYLRHQGMRMTCGDSSHSMLWPRMLKVVHNVRGLHTSAS